MLCIWTKHLKRNGKDMIFAGTFDNNSLFLSSVAAAEAAHELK